MLHLKTIEEINDYLDQLKPSSTVGLVPTMGALHSGHLALIEQAKKENDVVICSVFVNPMQFNNPDDLEKYPRNIEQDAMLLEKVDCDVLFAPLAQEIYPTKPAEKFDFGSMETVMEGKYRPGHFNGVAIVISRFFKLLRPNNAYFGEKDFQQLAIIKQLVLKTNLPVNIVGCSTIREQSGLAISSRNQRLSDSQKKLASSIYGWLQEAKSMKGKIPLPEAKKRLENTIIQTEGFKLDYFEFAEKDTLQPLNEWIGDDQCVCCIAVFLGEVRLIDNLLF